MESKVFKQANEFLSSDFSRTKKRDRGIKNLADLKTSLSLSAFFNLTDRRKENKLPVSKLLPLSVFSFFFLSLSPCLGLCCTVEASGGRC